MSKLDPQSRLAFMQAFQSKLTPSQITKATGLAPRSVYDLIESSGVGALRLMEGRAFVEIETDYERLVTGDTRRGFASVWLWEGLQALCVPDSEGLTPAMRVDFSDHVWGLSEFTEAVAEKGQGVRRLYGVTEISRALAQVKRFVQALDEGLSEDDEAFQAGVVLMTPTELHTMDVDEIVTFTGYPRPFVDLVARNLYDNLIWSDHLTIRFDEGFGEEDAHASAVIFWLAVCCGLGYVTRTEDASTPKVLDTPALPPKPPETRLTRRDPNVRLPPPRDMKQAKERVSNNQSMVRTLSGSTGHHRSLEHYKRRLADAEEDLANMQAGITRPDPGIVPTGGPMFQANARQMEVTFKSPEISRLHDEKVATALEHAEVLRDAVEAEKAHTLSDELARRVVTTRMTAEAAHSAWFACVRDV
jgi:hypothetical protein